MGTSPTSNHRHHPASCRGARCWLAIFMGASLLMALTVAADLLRHASHQKKDLRVVIQALSLSTPALHPAGSPVRHPETTCPAVDLRFAAGLERMP